MDLIYGEKSLTIIASYTPSDSFPDLTNALYNLLCYRLGDAVWQDFGEKKSLGISGNQYDVKTLEPQDRWLE